MTTTFKDWLISQYEPEELKDIAEHGCASCAPAGMIYYNETSKLYDQFCDDLHEIVGDFVEATGDDSLHHLISNIGSATSFKNAMVWMATELVAYDLTSEMME